MFSPHHICNTILLLPRLGFLLALQYLLRCRCGALMFAGFPCSAHVWLASDGSKKTRADPRGNVSLEFVQRGNMQASRFCLMVLVCKVRQVWWGGEQPNGSLALFLQYVQMVLHPCLFLLGFTSSFIQRMLLGLCLKTFCSVLSFCCFRS